MPNNKLPVRINITIASAIDAMEYWLSKVVFQEDIKIKSISFSEEDHFTIDIDRRIDKEDNTCEYT